jgi:type I site-specific restriction endonuclease
MNFDAACERVLRLPHDNPHLRAHQKAANIAIERAIAQRKRRLLVTMATGTGKTITLVNQIYRLMKTGVVRRVLVLAKSRHLVFQWLNAFSSFEVASGRKFHEVYALYGASREELADSWLTHAFVYVGTPRQIESNALGLQTLFGLEGERSDVDVGRVGDIPEEGVNLIVVDECYGSSSRKGARWESLLQRSNAIHIGLTCTPASPMAAHFRHTVFAYSHAQAVADGNVVDYDMVKIRPEDLGNHLLHRESRRIDVIDSMERLPWMKSLAEDRRFVAPRFNARFTAPRLTRGILEKIKGHAEEHERRYRRFPKTLIFAANDSHAERLVSIAREVFGRGEAFVSKITGRVDRWQQHLNNFIHCAEPGVVVTVELLTGVDMPDLEFLVFLRSVKSPSRFQQMIGRGARKGSLYPNKDHFKVFDCFDEKLLRDEDEQTPDSSGPGFVVFLLRKTMRSIAECIARFPDGLGEVQWPDLERVLREVFEGLGFETRHTPLSQDGGFDLELSCTKNGKRVTFLVEVKHWTDSRPGPKVLKNFFDVVIKRPAEAGLLLSSSGFTKHTIAGRTEIERQKVRLGGRTKIVTLCRQYVQRETGDWAETRALPEILFDDTD